MSGWWLALPAFVVAVLHFVIALVIDKEYDFWAPRLGAYIIRRISVILPRSKRERYREEWLAELYGTEGQKGPLLFALFLALPATIRISARAIADTLVQKCLLFIDFLVWGFGVIGVYLTLLAGMVAVSLAGTGAGIVIARIVHRAALTLSSGGLQVSLGVLVVLVSVALVAASGLVFGKAFWGDIDRLETAAACGFYFGLGTGVWCGVGYGLLFGYRDAFILASFLVLTYVVLSTLSVIAKAIALRLEAIRRVRKARNPLRLNDDDLRR